jgi:hypothetical protein
MIAERLFNPLTHSVVSVGILCLEQIGWLVKQERRSIEKNEKYFVLNGYLARFARRAPSFRRSSGSAE